MNELLKQVLDRLMAVWNKWTLIQRIIFFAILGGVGTAVVLMVALPFAYDRFWPEDSARSVDADDKIYDVTKHGLSTGECANEHDQRRFRQMKVSDERIDHPKTVARGNKNSGFPLERREGARSRRRSVRWVRCRSST